MGGLEDPIKVIWALMTVGIICIIVGIVAGLYMLITWIF